MSETIEQATWTADGEAANLAAASADAFEWLDLWRRHQEAGHPLLLISADREKLAGCTAALKEQLRRYLPTDPFDESDVPEEALINERDR